MPSIQTNPRRRGPVYTPYRKGISGAQQRKRKTASVERARLARRLRQLETRSFQKTTYVVQEANKLLLPPAGTVRVSANILNLTSPNSWDPVFGSSTLRSDIQPRATVMQYKLNLRLSIQHPELAMPKTLVQMICFRLKKETGTQVLKETVNLTSWDGAANGQYYQSSANDAQNMGPLILNPKFFNIVATRSVVMSNTVLKTIVAGGASASPTMFEGLKNQYETVSMTIPCNDDLYNPTGSANPQAPEHWKSLSSDQTEPQDRVYLMYYCSGYNSTIAIPGTTEANAVTVHSSITATVKTLM